MRKQKKRLFIEPKMVLNHIFGSGFNFWNIFGSLWNLWEFSCGTTFERKIISPMISQSAIYGYSVGNWVEVPVYWAPIKMHYGICAKDLLGYSIWFPHTPYKIYSTLLKTNKQTKTKQNKQVQLGTFLSRLRKRSMYGILKKLKWILTEHPNIPKIICRTFLIRPTEPL